MTPDSISDAPSSMPESDTNLSPGRRHESLGNSAIGKILSAVNVEGSAIKIRIPNSSKMLSPPSSLRTRQQQQQPSISASSGSRSGPREAQPGPLAAAGFVSEANIRKVESSVVRMRSPPRGAASYRPRQASYISSGPNVRDVTAASTLRNQDVTTSSTPRNQVEFQIRRTPVPNTMNNPASSLHNKTNYDTSGSRHSDDRTSLEPPQVAVTLDPPRSTIQVQQSSTSGAIGERVVLEKTEIVGSNFSHERVYGRPLPTELWVPTMGTTLAQSKINTVRECYRCRCNFTNTASLVNHLESMLCSGITVGVLVIYQAIRRVDTGDLITISLSPTDSSYMMSRLSKQPRISAPRYSARLWKCSSCHNFPSFPNKKTLDHHVCLGRHTSFENPTLDGTGVQSKVGGTHRTDVAPMAPLQRRNGMLAGPAGDLALSPEGVSARNRVLELYLCRYCGGRYRALHVLLKHLNSSPCCEEWYWDAATSTLAWHELLKAALSSLG
ncbi:hypothetical protein TWF696_002230 [Orbilia brochopaga]|uniref:C2H2-type domain-containing protein n=1 Tax=Orbilia brochopaga TaxID=3140254 RepID=A0AAV9U4Z0_9PEZI